jgi:hypothetical protein
MTDDHRHLSLYDVYHKINEVLERDPSEASRLQEEFDRREEHLKRVSVALIISSHRNK